MTDAAAAIRDQPLIAIDVVPVSFVTTDGLRVATARRAYAPYVGQEALPGVLLDGTEILADGARRALRSKVGVGSTAVHHLAQVGAFDGPDRDPRSSAISIAFLAVIDPAAHADATWHDVGTLPLGLPFDHDRIVASALERARVLLWSDLPFTRALLGDPFTTADAARLRIALTGTTPDPGNLNRTLRTNTALARVDLPASAGPRGGRPPAAWTWQD
ncbi:MULTISPECIES: NUDIX hydrolase [unclassified Curtobacterium]|uniref:NUDIX hydrolase n=1 Tax=unclassified Curtobacterium TaxID=257496 RepID=UPI000F4A3B0F|nr:MULTISPECIES: NUDIX hydrolase [unclassified Curtobacterium]ROQ05132.1 ADP-ribose pyrophosphatase YjhB (NUDIX family) [Curtobacterium sp. PhB171]ROQ22333.1 ADP-ribose pyrophosphatase YjhB (NUDIX family) [Curtobacterium sp. PhB170]ROS33693.1 ADP-ribose pyrophosphatase YjhB (NUDIX family) [Curtobacterium sp. PhB131]ROS65012.1 ADP-ribose pyrophosphatase YjhB (NUDIX family) [Curtobacterium sp. PhB141]